MHSEINEYINFRYNNWLDRAKYAAKIHGFEDMAGDLLNEVLENLISKPEDKLLEMLNRPTRKILNGRPTTELDKFVLKMINIQSFSQVGPFHKNTLGKKIISRNKGKVKVVQNTNLNGVEVYDDDDEPTQNAEKIEQMHRQNIKRLQQYGYRASILELYQQHYVYNRPLSEFSKKQQEQIHTISKLLTNKTVII